MKQFLSLSTIAVLWITTAALAYEGCLEFDNRWEALTMPQIATRYFCLEPLPVFEPNSESFTLTNAWWLSEVSRLIYKEGQGPLRNHYLEQAGLHETDFFDEDSIQCSLIESKDPNNPYVILVFRGTGDVLDWIKNLNVELVEFENQGRVHKGFYLGLSRVWDKIKAKLLNEKRAVFYCGHSLGGALVILAAAQPEIKPQAVYTYGCPKVGDAAFAESLANQPIYRIENHLDVVTTLPLTTKHFNYIHVGRSCYISHDNQIHLDPNEAFIARDRERIDRVFDKQVDQRKFYNPPEILSDHAPVNYSAHLERFLSQRGGKRDER